VQRRLDRDNAACGYAIACMTVVMGPETRPALSLKAAVVSRAR
jgi:hypothetical protein